MHACGHDVHSSIVLGTALVLNAHQGLHQGSRDLPLPAGRGGRAGGRGGGSRPHGPGRAPSTIRRRPRSSDSMSGRRPTGRVLIAPGNVTAAADSFSITVKGKSAHGARPQEGMDAVVIAAEIVTALQTIVSRATDPTDPAVLTVGTINGGSRRNIIADRVILEGTIRTLSEANRKKVRQLVESIVKNITEIYGAGYRFEYKPGNPSVFNNPELASAMTPDARPAPGERQGRRVEAADDRRGLRLPGPEGPRPLLLPGRQGPGPAGGAPPQPELQPRRECDPPGDADPDATSCSTPSRAKAPSPRAGTGSKDQSLPLRLSGVRPRPRHRRVRGPVPPGAARLRPGRGVPRGGLGLSSRAASTGRRAVAAVAAVAFWAPPAFPSMTAAYQAQRPPYPRGRRLCRCRPAASTGRRAASPTGTSSSSASGP